jgi:hypothetical protein
VNVTNTIGAPGAPLTAFNLTNATLRLRATGLATNIVVAMLNAGEANTIDVTAVPALAGEMCFPLIAYSSFNGSIGNFTLGSLPAGYSGTLIANTVDKTIDLMVAPVVPTPHISEISFDGSSLVLSGEGGMPGGAYCVRASTNLALPREHWPVVLTHVFDAQGRFNLTNATDAMPGRFYLLQTP